MLKAPSTCPVCKGELVVQRLACKSCQTTLENTFMFNVFERLTEEQTSFVLAFIKCDGSIKDLEKELGISYPTVKSRLAEIKRSLMLGEGSAPKSSDIIEMLSKGEISVDEAARLIRGK